MIDVIIVSYNALQYLKKTIESFEANGNYHANITIIDNNSTDGSKEWLKESKHRVIFNDSNVGYGKALNQGVALGSMPFLVLCNCDIEVTKDWDKFLINHLITDNYIGCIAPKILNTDGTIGSCGIKSWQDNLNGARGWQEKDEGQYDKCEYVATVSGAFMMIERQLFEQVNGFDEEYLFYYEERDLHKRLEQIGYNCFYCAETTVIHHWNKSIGGFKNNNTIIKSYERFMQKWNQK